MNKIYYWQGAIGSRNILNHHEQAIRKLLTSDYQNSDLEKLSGSHSRLIYSYRLNNKARLLFTTRVIKGQSFLLVLEHLPDHDYQKSRYLKKGVLRNELNRQSNTFEAITTEERPAFESSEESPRIEAIALDYFNQQFIQLSPTQEEALHASFPMIINGVGGSGKSYVALSILAQYIKQNTTNEPMRALYVTKESSLVSEMTTIWDDFIPARNIPENVQVEFKTFNDLIDPSLVLAEKDFFDHWITTHKKALNGLNATTIRQEFRICCGFTQQEYCALGKLQSSIQAEKRPALYTLYNNYLSHLAASGKIDPDFYQGNANQQTIYDVIVNDESQNSSLAQHRYLSRLAKNQTIAYCWGMHQPLIDACATRPLLEKLFWSQANPRPMTTITLDKTWRCPINIAKVLDIIISMKHHISGGKTDKIEATTIQVEDTLNTTGHVFLLNSHELDQDQYAWIQTRAMGNNFAVVTRLELIEEAKKRFNTPLVLTTESCQGLEYHTVLLYKLLSDDTSLNTLKAIRSRLECMQPDNQQKNHRAKEGQADNQYVPWFNRHFTTCSRSSNTLIMCEDTTRDNAPYLNLINESVQIKTTPADAENEAQPETDWQQEIIKQTNQGNLDIATHIYQEKLGTTKATINTFVPREIKKKSSPKKSAFTPNEIRLIDLINDYKNSKLKDILCDDDAMALLFDTPIKTEPAYFSLFSYITQSDARINKFCILMGLLHRTLVTPAFAERIISFNAPAPINEKLCSILALHHSKLLKKKKGNAVIPQWGSTQNKDRILSLYSPDEFITLLSSLKGEHELFTAVELGLALAVIKDKQSGMSVLNYICFHKLSTLLNLHTYCTQIIRNIPHKAWGDAPLEGEYKHESPLAFITGTQTGFLMLLILFDQYPEIITGIPMAAWTLAPAEGNFTNLSPLFLMAGNSGHFQSFKLLLENHPAIIESIPSTAWGLVATNGELRNMSPLFFLTRSVDDQNLLRILFEKHRTVFESIPAKAWATAPTEGPYKNICPLLLLAGSAEGRRLLSEFVEQCPSMFNQIPPEAWHLAATDGMHKNISALFFLARHLNENTFLQKLVMKCPDAFSNIPAEAWSLSPTEGENDCRSPIFLLAATPAGRLFLHALLIKIPAIFKNISAETWFLAPNEGENANISPLFLLAGNMEGQIFLKGLYDTNPFIFDSIPIPAWYAEATEGLYKGQSPMSILEQTRYQTREGGILFSAILNKHWVHCFSLPSWSGFFSKADPAVKPREIGIDEQLINILLLSLILTGATLAYCYWSHLNDLTNNPLPDDPEGISNQFNRT